MYITEKFITPSFVFQTKYFTTKLKKAEFQLFFLFLKEDKFVSL
jgi:hypothetical protein